MRRVHPILSSILYDKSLAALIILEFAVLVAVWANISNLGLEFLSEVHSRSGLNEERLYVVELSRPGDRASNIADLEEDIGILRDVTDVTALAAINQFPFGSVDWSASIKPAIDQPGTQASIYLGVGELEKTLGIEIVRGRGFETLDYVSSVDWNKEPQPAVVLISESLAEALYGDLQSPIGRTLYRGTLGPFTIVGVYRRLVRPYLTGGHSSNSTAIFPMSPTPTNDSQAFALRTFSYSPSKVDTAVRFAIANASGVVKVDSVRPFVEIRNEFFATEIFSLWVLTGFGLAVLLVTIVGIYCTLGFWYHRRISSLTTLRAIGVSESQVILHLQVENLFLAIVGVAVGLPSGFAINFFLKNYLSSAGPRSITILGAGLIPIIVGQTVAFSVSRRIRRISMTHSSMTN